MSGLMKEIDERTNLTNNNQFELLLFRLGSADRSGQNEIFGINVFKVREILVMPKITTVFGSAPEMLGMADIRGQVIPVIDLGKVVGCSSQNGGPGILLVTEYARSTQGFAVESVEEIVRLEWNRVVSAEANVKGGLVTSIAKLDPDTPEARLVQVLDVEQILRDVMPTSQPDVDPATVGPQLALRPGSKVLAADDSALARGLIEQGLHAMGVQVMMTKTGQEAWDQLNEIADTALKNGRTVQDEIAVVLTDLEMPEMDGFTLTRKIKADARFRGIPVVIHSSLSGTASEDHVRKVGADAYVSKFLAKDLAETIRGVLRAA
ncbi:chemotaxis protein [Cupriavidus respiraculi]|uniref:Chemotaxis protein CheV n=1 Tax=Cupriavidus respiraculi TaxID=195930 RepID=A0ABN7Y6G8_9BURK|nr:chemotaxis protein [Cupriavidus respiraculi]CAG9168932.1 Chemotaxis protein CheV [Cupriavidus respiraculi]